MQHAEREQFAAKASARAQELLGKQNVGAFYTDALTQKIVVALKALDAAAIAADKPLLVTSVLPGFDLIVAKPQGVRVDFDDTATDVRALSKLDLNTVELLGRIADSATANAAEGAFTFKSHDGLHYFAFRSQYREKALQAVGVLPDGLQQVEATAEVLQ